MPAIVDPDGPGGKPISIFESGAILQYLGRKSGKLYPADERGKVQVEEWLFWQVGGLGPMAGQAFHFLSYSQEDLTYAKKRYSRRSPSPVRRDEQASGDPEVSWRAPIPSPTSPAGAG